MGGQIPLGYDLEKRKLPPNHDEAAFVCRIFNLYLELGCVVRLAAQLRQSDVKTKVWNSKRGMRLGGRPFSRGHLYYLLRNRLYIGEIRHRDQWYPGEHQGIVPRGVWDRVQARLDQNAHVRRNDLEQRRSSLLSGLIWDGEGNRFTPSFTVKRGRRYRYYVSQLVLNGSIDQTLGPTRFPAHDLEARVIDRLQALLKSDAEVFDALDCATRSPRTVHRILAGAKKLATLLTSGETNARELLTNFLRKVTVCENRIDLTVGAKELYGVLTGSDVEKEKEVGNGAAGGNDTICLTIEVKRTKRNGSVHLVVPPTGSGATRHPRSALIKAVVRGHVWHQRLLEGGPVELNTLAQEAGLTSTYVRNVLGFAFLAPDIVDAILDGYQPPTLKFADLYKGIPLSWADQRRVFGFPAIESR